MTNATESIPDQVGTEEKSATHSRFGARGAKAWLTRSGGWAVCLSFAGAREEFPFDEATSVFKVAGKIFALSRLNGVPLRISLKCDPGLAIQLRTSYASITGGYHLNKRHGNTVVLEGSVPDQLLHDMIEDSYDLVVAGLPPAQRKRLGWVALSCER